MLKSFLIAMADARGKHQPLADTEDRQSYLRSIRHYHPFDMLPGEVEDEVIRCTTHGAGDRS